MTQGISDTYRNSEGDNGADEEKRNEERTHFDAGEGEDEGSFGEGFCGEC